MTTPTFVLSLMSASPLTSVYASLFPPVLFPYLTTLFSVLLLPSPPMLLFKLSASLQLLCPCAGSVGSTVFIVAVSAGARHCFPAPLLQGWPLRRPLAVHFDRRASALFPPSRRAGLA